MTIPDVCLVLLTGVAVNLAVAARRYLVTLTRVEDVWLLRRQSKGGEG
jgi:hypothetical protein